MLCDIPECDVLIIAGDICPDDTPEGQAEYLAGAVKPFLEYVPAGQVIAIPGNHDVVFQQRPDLIPTDMRWHLLVDQAVTLDGVKFYGTPWTPTFCDWAFMLSEQQLQDKWAEIPPCTDILISHGPPYQAGDKEMELGQHVGSPSLRSWIEQNKPMLTFCGHIHEGRGEYRVGNSVVVNVSMRDGHYQPIKSVYAIELDR